MIYFTGDTHGQFERIGLDQSTVDKSTEEWLGEIEAKLDYRKFSG